MTRPILFGSVIGCALLLAWGWFPAGYAIPGAVVLAIGLLWLIAEIARWQPAAYLGLFLAALGAGAGEQMHLPAISLLLGLACALAAWDLSAFSRRMAMASPQDDRQALELRHLGRLAAALGTGIALGLLALGIHTVRFKFELAAVLALLGIWGLSLLLTRMRQRAE